MTRDGGPQSRSRRRACPGASAGSVLPPGFHGFCPERREKKHLSLSPYYSATEAAGSQHRGQPLPMLCGLAGLPGGDLPAQPVFLTPWPCGCGEVTCPASFPQSVK